MDDFHYRSREFSNLLRQPVAVLLIEDVAGAELGVMLGVQAD